MDDLLRILDAPAVGIVIGAVLALLAALAVGVIERRAARGERVEQREHERRQTLSQVQRDAYIDLVGAARRWERAQLDLQGVWAMAAEAEDEGSYFAVEQRPEWARWRIDSDALELALTQVIVVGSPAVRALAERMEGDYEIVSSGVDVAEGFKDFSNADVPGLLALVRSELGADPAPSERTE